MSQNKGDDLGSFKIGGLPGFGPGAGTAAPAAPAAATPAPVAAPAVEDGDQGETLFVNLEQLLEREDISDIAEQMGATCSKLDEIIEKRTGRAQAHAHTARLAYQHTFDLIDHLLQVKTDLLASQQES